MSLNLPKDLYSITMSALLYCSVTGCLTKCAPYRLRSSHPVFGKVLSHHCGLTRFGNLEVSFVLLSLLSLCFVIIIKYSRAQGGTQAIIPPSLSLSVALELNGYFE